MIICFMSLFRILDVYWSQFIVTLLFLSFLMFIDSFRGLGTSLVEGCAGDFRPNAADCERVHPSAHQRASEGIRQSRSRTFAPMPKTTAQVQERSPQCQERPPKVAFGQIRSRSVAQTWRTTARLELTSSFVPISDF